MPKFAWVQGPDPLKSLQKQYGHMAQHGPAAPRIEGTSGFKALRIMRITRIMKAPALCGLCGCVLCVW